MSVADLIENVDRQIVKIRTNSLDVSFNELYDMYQNGELVIAPDYQRLFRWEEETQSRFMESLILEMPVPPIYAVETDDGIYELIDGLQRISSYLHFRGEPLGEGNSEPLILKGCDIVPDLNGLTFAQLPKAIQIKLKRSFVRMEVIRKESEPTLKYHMFKRLNTGGLLLSAQEIRNCTIRLLGDRGINFIDECSRNEDFMALIKCVGEDRLKARYDQELALRFFALRGNKRNLLFLVATDEYLTKFLERMTSGDFDYKNGWQVFCDTFRLIRDVWGEEAFIYHNPKRVRFHLSAYDDIIESIAFLLDNISYPLHETDESIKNHVVHMRDKYFENSMVFRREMHRFVEEVVKKT